MQLFGLTQKIRYGKFLLRDNSSAILTGMAVTGTVTTAYLSGRASFKAARIIEEERNFERFENHNGEIIGPLREVSTVSMVKLTWKLFVPAVGVGATTITCILLSNKLSSKKVAALTLASGISERALQEYKDKVVERLGERQDRDLRDEIAQDRVSGQPVNPREIILAGTGEVLCYDMTTGRYFQSTVEEIKRAENKINYNLIHFMSASLSEFYDEIGLPPTTYSDAVGWNLHNKMEVMFSTTMSSDGRPCIAIDFSKQPIADYDRTAWDG